MQIRRIFLFLLLTLMTTFVLDAQSRVEQRAKNRANQNVDREIDKAVDKTFDKIGGLFKKKNKKKDETTEDEVDDRTDSDSDEELSEEEQQRQAQEMVNRMLGGGNDEEWEPIKNDFPISFDAEIKMVKKGKEEVNNIKYTFDTWKTGLQMSNEEAEDIRLIMDNQEGSMTTITTQDGKTQGFKMRQQVVNIDDTQMNSDDVKVTKTNETKTINGYLCTKYLVETEDGNSTAWVTKEINMDMTKLMANLSIRNKGKKKSGGLNGEAYQGVEGLPIETTYVPKNGKETTIMTLSNIKTGNNIDRNIFNTSGVEIMSVGF